jgi:very-short-patch-repair endonuclease
VSATDYDDDWTTTYLGAAAELCRQFGSSREAALLLDVRGIEFLYQTMGFNVDHPDQNVEMCAAVLICEPWIMDRFDQDASNRIMDALNQIAHSNSRHITELNLVPAPADADWRDRLENELRASPNNQATRVPASNFEIADAMQFRDRSEVAVYQGLKRAQERRAKAGEETLMIVPNASARVRERTWEPDFIVTYRGRSGIIEVDGATHRGKWAIDRSRDRVFEDSGAALVDHIDASFTNDPKEIDAFVERFLKRLGDMR